MKVNSNTIHLDKASAEYEILEKIVTKVASENNIEDVTGINIHIDSEKGMIQFKQSCENPGKEEEEEESDED